MISVIGFSSIILALIVALLQPALTIIYIIKFENKQILNFNFNAKNNHLQLSNFVKYLVIIIFLFCLSAFLCLVYSYIISDYSIANVYLNSHHLKPLIYKISGAWGNHEGSALLLTLILSIYNLAFMILSKVSHKLKINILSVQSLIISGFLAFIAFTSNPFKEIFPAPITGLGLNPLLQDIGLAFHPPILYSGYIGFSLIFSFAITALLNQNLNKNFIQSLKPWLMFCWSFLTLGIGLGSWWAYRELGWGGYWFWDPVENVSLMPWLCATALFHSLIITAKTNNFKIWSCFLSILTFVFCLLGIFLVRSGILTSVHSFANDPKRGIFIILLLLLIGGGGFLIFALKASKLRSGNNYFALFSKSGLVLINNLLLCLALFIITLATLYPLFLEILTDSSISIGAPYYKQLFAPLAVAILSLMIFVPSLKLKNFNGFSKNSIKKIAISSLLSLLCLSLLILVDFEVKIIALLLIFIALTLLLYSLFDLFYLAFNKKLKFLSGKIINSASFSYYSMFLGHCGIALIAIAIATTSLLSDFKEINMKLGDNIKIANYNVIFSDLKHAAGKNYLARIAIFQIKSLRSNPFLNENYKLKAESRYYPISNKNTTEAAIKHNILSDLYLVLGNKDEEGNFAVRIYYKPLISLLWVGCLIMFCGGLLAAVNSVLNLKKVVDFYKK